MNGGGNKMDTTYVQWLKGLAIVLVVVGHFYSAVFSSVWIEGARRVIYLFHMPLFMAISGFLYALSRPLPFGALVKKKALRLMLPYVSISALVLAAKWSAGAVHFQLQHPVQADDLWAFLFFPHRGFACFLWYIYTLFVIFGLVRALEAARVPLWLMFLMALGLRFVPLPPYFCLNLVGAHLVYFMFGMGLKRLTGAGAFNARWATAAAMAGCWAGFGLLAWLILAKGVSGGGWSVLTAISGILSCWTLAMCCGRRPASFLAWIGGASSAIYLLHTLSMGIARYAWEQGIGVDSRRAQVLFFVTSVSLAVMLPALFQRFVLDRFPWAGKVLLGAAPGRHRA